MQIFDIHKKIISDYESFITSFVNIRNDKIRKHVEDEIESKKLWPEPLIQFNPSYVKGQSFEELSNSKIINPALPLIFKGYKPFKHQIDAIKIALSGKDFVVTSGTGSGKSLTYLATIFDYVLSNPHNSRGLVSIIVYPMNALINSQSEEIKKYAENYRVNTGNDFPIRFEQFTGQENEEDRIAIRKNPPHILLTNYMMLELIMTRSGESEIRKSIKDNLRFLVFDELHTYRGRQGSDVSMLIRRIKSSSVNNLLCMGTSATMVSNNDTSLLEQKEAIANVASRIFGTKFDKSQIINESLLPSLCNDLYSINIKNLKASFSNPIDLSGDANAFRQNAVAKWIELNISLDKKEETFVRRKPQDISEMANELSSFTGFSIEECKKRILEILNWAINLNTYYKESLLPFKIHQFISQTGTVYSSLDQGEDQIITLNPGVYSGHGEFKKPLFPVVFSRITGTEFYCVFKNEDQSKLEPREFSDTKDEDEEAKGGYIIPDLTIWDPAEDIGNLPDTYFQTNSKGEKKLKKEYNSQIPTKIYYDEFGNYSTSEIKKYEAWYMPANLLFDPSSGTFYDRRTKEGTKLTKLGTEGRSTSTTVLSFSILKHLSDFKYSEADQKLLSFTDNRQDAALQSGHFNDYMDVIKLRAAIYKAVRHSTNNTLDITNLSQSILESLQLKQTEFARNPSDFPGASRDNEDALKDYLMYRALFDLRRGWRVILPNLEQCALLNIDYKYLNEASSLEKEWESVTLLKNLSLGDREQLIKIVLDHFRKEYAIYSANYLVESVLNTKVNNIKEKLKEPWTFEEDDKPESPYYLVVKSISKGVKFYYNSIGYRSRFGKFFRDKFSEIGFIFNQDSYVIFMEQFLEILSRAGYIRIETKKDNRNEAVNVYQLNADKILWQLGNEENVQPDVIKMLSYKENKIKPNYYFQNIYKTDFAKYKKFTGNVHTGQNNNVERKEREEKFRSGEISALYCSPTMELGIDISTLNVVHMRNAPPNPSNYAQRSGRAGRSGQAALIFTYCSSFSPHDVHYFKKSDTLVSGNVVPPKIELNNQELLLTHLNAIILSEVGLDGMNRSISQLIDENDTVNLPLRIEVKDKLILSDKQKNTIKNKYLSIISDFKNDLIKSSWYNDEWITINIERFAEKFNKSLDRWRLLYQSAISQRTKAQYVINSAMYTLTSNEMKAAFRDERQAVKQIALLQNTGSNFNSISEFYPYRYFASEGFLPGYNFTRLPIRAFIPDGDSGVFISRPRFIALREYGPGNVIYHNGKKYKIDQILAQDIENNLKKAKVVKSSGYYLEGSDITFEKCPLTNIDLSNNECNFHAELLEMSETKTVEQTRISCEEEERLAYGYKIDTYFSIPAGVKTVKHALVKNDEDSFLNLKFIPAAKLIQVNSKWRISPLEGFPIGLNTGQWKKQKQIETSTEQIRNIKLFSSDTSDSLYIEPISSLGLTRDGVITLQYAFKRAIEILFQVESNEIGVTLMGESFPNIFLYEASEGSLGILSQFMEDPSWFKKLVDEAYKICKFDDKSYTDPASYNDLLSYYNQRYHLQIDRFEIKDALEKLKVCHLEINTSNAYPDYESHYQSLLNLMDRNSSTELEFLKHLYKNGLRLPDEAQMRVDGIYSQPDFFYKPDIHVFCDGTPHDQPEIKEKDEKIREAIRNKGQQVIVYYYKDSLDNVINKRPDVFRKVK